MLIYSPITYRLWTAFKAMLIAWLIGVALHFVYQIFFSGWGRATDVSAILFWSGLFVSVSAVTFVPIATILFRLAKLPLWVYPLTMSITAFLAINLLLLPLISTGPALSLFSLSFGLVAGGIGLLFGAFYLFLTGYGLSPSWPSVLLLLCFVLLWVGRVIAMHLAPVWSYNHLDSYARQELVYRAVSNIQTGEPIKNLNSLLPGFVSDSIPRSGHITKEGPGVIYDIYYINGIVSPTRSISYQN